MLWDDGPHLVDVVADPNGTYYHPVFPFVARAFSRLWPAPLPGDMRAFVALAAALASAVALLIARSLGAERGASLAAAALAAATTSLWNAGTTVELHVLTGCAVSASALVALRAPWRRPAVAAVSVLASAALLPSVHATALGLLPGWAGLVALGRRRAGLTTSPRALGLWALALPTAGVGAAFLLGEGAQAWRLAARYVEQRPLGPDEHLWREWLRPNAVLMPLALFGLLLGAAPGWVRLALAAVIAPCVVGLAWQGFEQRGGYSLVALPFTVSAAAFGLARLRAMAPVAGLALVALQARVAWHDLAGFRDGWSLERRARLLEPLAAEGCLVLSVQRRAPSAVLWVPSLVGEVDVAPAIRSAALRGLGPDEFALEALEQIEEVRRATGAGVVVLDTSFRRHDSTRRHLAPWLEAVARELERRCGTERLDDPVWSALVVRRCRSEER